MISFNNHEKENELIVRKNKYNLIWVTLVFLVTLNIFGQQHVLLLGTFFIGLLICIKKRTVFRISIDFLLLVLFSISYFFIYSINETVSINAFYLYFFAPVIAFFIGYFLVDNDEQFIKNTIIAVALGTFIYGSLNMYLYITEFGTNASFRGVPDIWGGQYRNATLQGTLFTTVGSLLFYSIYLLSQGRTRSFILIVFGILFSIYSSMVLGNRTLLIIVIVTLLLNLILYVLENKRFFSSKIIFILLGIMLLFFVPYYFNFYDMQSIILNSNLYERMLTLDLSEDLRFETFKMITSQLFIYPFGGHLIPLKYAHNLWLDVLLIVGLIPFFFLVLYTIKILLNLFKLTKSSIVSTEFKILIFSIYTGYLLNFMVEPILEGVPFMFITFCLINGMVKKYLYIIDKINY